MLTVTTSWDDGDILDKKLAELLDRYHIKGTFYITKQYRKERLSEDDIRTLSLNHEIGAHTLTHPDLTTLTFEDQLQEIAGSKQWLEEILGKEVSMFCYPSGRYNDDSIRATKEAGFRGARTVECGRIDLPQDPYQMPTTVHVYPMPFRKVDATHFWWRKLLQPFFDRSPALRTLGVSFFAFRSFEVMACAAFDIARTHGEVFHLWGHSWEIEKYDMWKELEYVLQYMSNAKDCRYVTNGEIIKTSL